MDDMEICDRCGKDLDKLKGEDIYLEKKSMVVCTDCHTEEDKQFW